MTAFLIVAGMLFVAAAAWWWPWLDRFADELEHPDAYPTGGGASIALKPKPTPTPPDAPSRRGVYLADIVWWDAPIGRAVHDHIYGGKR